MLKVVKNDFYADDVLYYTTSTNQGYDATLTIANITQDFRVDVLGETLVGTDNVLAENSLVTPKKIAFLFEFDGDVKATKHCLYNVTVSRPGMDSVLKLKLLNLKPRNLN